MTIERDTLAERLARIERQLAETKRLAKAKVGTADTAERRALVQRLDEMLNELRDQSPAPTPRRRSA